MCSSDLSQNIGRTLYDINHSKILFDPPPREMEIKAKINKWDLPDDLNLDSEDKDGDGDTDHEDGEGVSFET